MFFILIWKLKTDTQWSNDPKDQETYVSQQLVYKLQFLKVMIKLQLPN